MAQEWLEVLEKRNRTSKTKRLHIDDQPTNKFSLDATIAPMHYKDAGAEWQDIRAELLPSTQSIVGFGNPAFEMVENEYEMFVLGTLNSGVPLVRYVSKNTEYWVQFAAHNLVWTNDLDQIELIATPATTTTEVSVSECKWPDAYGAGLDLRYIAGLGRMSKWLDIASALPSPPQFIIDGGNPVIEFAEILEFHKDLEVWVNGAEWNKSSDISSVAEIEFRSPDGEVRFVFPVAAGYHEGEAEDANIVGQLHLKKQGPNLYVTARFPWAWLQSAVYPVHLDTTITPQIGAGSDDAHQLGTAMVLDGEYLNLYTATAWGGLRLTGVDLASDATVSVAYLSFYLYSADDDYFTGKDVYCEDGNNPGTFTTALNNISGRTRTTAKVTLPAGQQGTGWKDTSSLVDPVQEVVDDNAGTGDALIFIIDSTTSDDLFIRTWEYDDNTWGAKLHIEYTAGGESYSLVIDAGSYAVTGTAAGLPVGRVMGAGAGSYAVAGVAVGLLRDLLIGAGAGSYALSGNAVSLPVDRVIGAGAGSYSLTGATVALLKDVLISAGAGSYAISGTAASLLLDWVLSADAGAYAITGADADLLKALIMAAAGGTYTLTGADVAFLRGKIMTAEAGLYVLTGSDIDLLKAMIIAAAGGTYTIAGQESSLRVTIGAVLEPIIGVLRAIDVVEGMLVEKDKTRSGLSTGRPKAVID